MPQVSNLPHQDLGFDFWNAFGGGGDLPVAAEDKVPLHIDFALALLCASYDDVLRHSLRLLRRHLQ